MDEDALRIFKAEGPLIVVPEMRRQVPLGKTGFLRESVGSRETPRGFTVFAGAPYAVYVDKGTKPHVIFPKKAKVLRWFGVWGQPIFAKRVKHPGTKGVFFTRKTMEAVRNRIIELAKECVRRVLHG